MFGEAKYWDDFENLDLLNEVVQDEEHSIVLYYIPGSWLTTSAEREFISLHFYYGPYTRLLSANLETCSPENVYSAPTIVHYLDGKEKKRFIGVTTMGDLVIGTGLAARRRAGSNGSF